jgi:hypothetical protein
MCKYVFCYVNLELAREKGSEGESFATTGAKEGTLIGRSVACMWSAPFNWKCTVRVLIEGLIF